MTTKLRALRAFRFAGEWIQPGDVIECDEKIAGDLLMWGWAEQPDNARVALVRTHQATDRPPNWVTRQ